MKVSWWSRGQRRSRLGRACGVCCSDRTGYPPQITQDRRIIVLNQSWPPALSARNHRQHRGASGLSPAPPDRQDRVSPLRFEEPAPAPLETLAGPPTLRLVDKGARRSRPVSALLQSEASRNTSLIGGFMQKSSRFGSQSHLFGRGGEGKGGYLDRWKVRGGWAHRGVRGPVEACSDWVPATGARGCIVIIIWFAG